MKNIAPVRAALGVRTVFNILGPLTNPAAPPFHVIGAYDLPTAGLMAEALAGMDIERAFVVHGAAGWDEPTPIGPFELFDVRAGRGAARAPRCRGLRARALRGRGTRRRRCGPQCAACCGACSSDRERGPQRDALLLGAALALEVSGLEPEPRAAVARAARAIDSGAAADCWRSWGSSRELRRRLRKVTRV